MNDAKKKGDYFFHTSFKRVDTMSTRVSKRAFITFREIELL